MIGEARTHFHRPALYSYEAGSIYEGKRDYAAAVRQYIRAAKADSPAEARLLTLAERPKYAPRRRRHLGGAFAAARYCAGSRETLGRRGGAAEARRGHRNLGPTLDFIESTAGRYGFASIQEAAAERHIAISRDPIDRIRLRLALMRIQEAHGAIAAARQTVDAVVHDNPTSSV